MLAVGLIVYESPLYQVLSLEPTSASEQAVARTGQTLPISAILRQMLETGGAQQQQPSPCVNCHIKCDWQWFWPNYVRLSLPQYLRLGEKIQETGLLVSLTGWL